MKIIHVENSGRDYRLVLGSEPRPAPGPGQVLITVAAAGLNNADLLQARGHYPPPPGASPILGMEVSGTIAELGDGVAGWRLGEKVCALLPGGGYAQFALADAGSVLPVPDAVDLMEAAGLPEAAFTAWTNIIDTGRLASGESLLIHGGTSGIGSLAIQMFAARGHRVFTTAGSDAKCEAARSFGATRAINYTREDFVGVVKQETGGKGVDVILDMVGGDYIQRNIEAAATWGRIVNIAYQKGSKAEVNFAPVLTKRLTLAATTLRGRDPEQKRAIRDVLLQEVWPLLGSRVKPVIARVFPLAEAQQAHEFMAKTGHIGKILLTF
ncbi:MAG: NAD(P)H-quinone oxidoreductase [Alphaproteobacteria bacterium]|nr:NAD(P)H-quinone oxidoreductase [Alphaproteobacteria bacterium]